ncbi:hypothetical protein [Photobacterium damselae]|uniref:hypothetical protein n=1 Tax=Photobacterium damselae TaxID=38293 RepID=UPI0040680E5A
MEIVQLIPLVGLVSSLFALRIAVSGVRERAKAENELKESLRKEMLQKHLELYKAIQSLESKGLVEDDKVKRFSEVYRSELDELINNSLSTLTSESKASLSRAIYQESEKGRASYMRKLFTTLADNKVA